MATHNHDAALEAELNELRRNYEHLRDDKLRTEQNLTNLEQQLEQLEADARREFGTADPEQLEELLKKRREENQRLVQEYRAHIQQVQAGLQGLQNGNGNGGQ